MFVSRLNNKARFVPAVIFLLLFVVANRHCPASPAPTKQQTLQAMRKAAEFYLTTLGTEAGYHPAYTVRITPAPPGKDPQWQISGRGPQTAQQATPTVGMAFLHAWHATADPYFLRAAQSAAHGILTGQMCSGGWDERVTELDPVKRKDYRFRADGNCPQTGQWMRDFYEPNQTGDKQVDPRRNMTNMDNNITQSVVRMLMRVDRALNFQDRRLHEAVLHALDYLVLAQYPIGAWPRNYEKLGDPNRFPVIPAAYPETWSRTWTRPAFYSYYNLNDDCTMNVMDAMLEAARIYNDPKYRASAERAGVFLLLAQMPDPQPAWAQQYNPQMQPSWARSMEPPAISGRESVSVLYALLTLYRETGKKKYLEPVPRALKYLKSSSFERNGKRVLARFYELKTNRPLYITPGSPDVRKITYSPEHLKRGYTFFTSAEPLEKIAQQYRRLLTANPQDLRRPEKLDSLKPFTYTPLPALSKPALAEKAAAVISALDEHGAWLQPQAAGQSTTEPAPRHISSGTFARNIKLLCDYLASTN